MRKLVLPLVLSVFALCGCAHQYVMKLTNGVEISTPSKPKLKGANYYYKDAKGNEHPIAQSRVAAIMPASFAAEEKKVAKYPEPKRHWWQFWR
jgi:hypothetical protein